MTDKADVAKFYGLYVSVFRFNYQADSVVHYLDLMEKQIAEVNKPTDAALKWYFEKGRYAIDQSDYEASLAFFQHRSP